MKRALTVSFALCSLFVSGNSEALDKQTSAGKKRDLVEHRFDLKGCAFTLSDKPGTALPYLDAESRTSGAYRVIDNRKTDAGISISFRCDAKPAQVLCPEETRITDANESDQRYLDDIRIVRYDRINDTHYGIASSFNLTGTARPWARKLIWCIGDDHRTLWGDSIVGNENNEHAERILEILRTIRFVDSESPETPPASDENPQP